MHKRILSQWLNNHAVLDAPEHAGTTKKPSEGNITEPRPTNPNTFHSPPRRADPALCALHTAPAPCAL